MSINQMTTEQQRDEKLKNLIQVLPKRSPEAVMQDIQALIGMEEAKENALTFLRRQRLEKDRRSAGLKTSKRAQHTVFTGNPGTGKTTMARLRAELLYALGLGGEKYLEITREKVVGEVIGATEANITKMIEGADQIFIDEAYALVDGLKSSNDFGQHVVSALITALENERNDLVVMFAGYPEEMKEFLATNPGFESRIAYTEHFPDYSIEELTVMLVSRLKDEEYSISEDALELAARGLSELKKKVGARNFGNARVVRTMVEQLPDHISNRLYPELGKVEPAAVMSQKEVESTIASKGKLSQMSSGLFVVEGARAGEDLGRKDSVHDAGLLSQVTAEDVLSYDIVNRGIKEVKEQKRSIGFAERGAEDQAPDFAKIARKAAALGA